MICHCLLNRFFRRIASCIRAGIGGRGSARGRLQGFDAASASVIVMMFVELCYHLYLASAGMMCCDWLLDIGGSRPVRGGFLVEARAV